MIYVPLIVPLQLRGLRLPFSIEAWRTAVDEFMRIPADLFTSDDELCVSDVEILRLDEDQSQELRLSNRIGFVSGFQPFWKVTVVEVSAMLKLREFSSVKKLTKNDAQAIHDEVATGELQRLLKRWITASLLAKPGIVAFSDVLALRQGKYLSARDDGPLGLLGEHLEVAQTMKWPPLQDLPIELVWRWLRKLPEFNVDFGTTKVGIAVAAFTHLLGRRGQVAAGEDLLWALLGLEALYARGTAELASQLVTKTQVLLGEQATFKKAVSQMYNYRSRFVHGDVPIPTRYCEYDATRHYEEYAQDIERHNMIATNVLTSTLQILAQRGWRELSFKWQIVEPSGS